MQPPPTSLSAKTLSHAAREDAPDQDNSMEDVCVSGAVLTVGWGRFEPPIVVHRDDRSSILAVKSRSVGTYQSAPAAGDGSIEGGVTVGKYPLQHLNQNDPQSLLTRFRRLEMWPIVARDPN